MIKFYKTSRYLSIYLILSPLLQFCLIGCSNNLEDFVPSNTQLVRCELIFTDSQSQSRGIISEFPDNAVLFIQFIGEKTYDWTKAIYSASERKWVVEFPEEILSLGNGSCKVAYADTGSFTLYGSGLEIKENTSVMMAEDGIWNVYGNVIVVTAHLEPVFSRIRFVSDSPIDIWAKGFGLPYIYYNSSYCPISDSYPESAPCYPKFISVRQKGEDGKFYSEYYYTQTTKCEYFHAIGSYGDREYVDCPEFLKLSIYYPSEPAYYYYKNISEFKAGESYLVKLPSTSDYSGWTQSNNNLKTISSEIKIGDGSNTSHRYTWEAGSVIFGKCINFEISSNGGNGYVYITNTNFSWKPLGAYSGKKISTIYYSNSYGFGRLTFGFNVSSLTLYYTIYKNVTVSQFPIYELFAPE